ncbi:MAG: helix-turn-helix transcriptional regulator, partial [Phycisphaerales bacterium]|nr:helix-turn-helix transcriptional regulator [Phycisphaerales bacterium]
MSKSRVGGFVPERLTEARESRGLSCAELAELLGVTRAAPSAWENGKRTPELQPIASVLR